MMAKRTELDEIGDELARLKYQLMGIKVELKLRRRRYSTKDGFDPDQPRDEQGRWTDEGGTESTDEAGASNNSVTAIFADFESLPLAARPEALLGGTDSSNSEPTLQPAAARVTYSTARTGIPTIDETTAKLTDTLIDVMNRADFIPEQTPQAFGVAVHFEFASSVRGQDLPGVSVEQSFLFKEVVTYGVAGSIRTDVILRNVAEEVIAIYDVKTGGAVLSGSRADELREGTKAGPYTPVIELHFERGSRFKHEPIEQDIWIGATARAGHSHVRR